MVIEGRNAHLGPYCRVYKLSPNRNVLPVCVPILYTYNFEQKNVVHYLYIMEKFLSTGWKASTWWI